MFTWQDNFPFLIYFCRFIKIVFLFVHLYLENEHLWGETLVYLKILLTFLTQTVLSERDKYFLALINIKFEMVVTPILSETK